MNVELRDHWIIPGILSRVKSDQQLAGEIIDIIAHVTKVDAIDIISKRKPREVIGPRFMVAYLIRKYTDLSLKKTGQELGGRSHATILNAVKETEYMISSGFKIHEQFRTQLETAENKVKHIIEINNTAKNT